MMSLVKYHALFQGESFRKYFTNTSWLLVERVINQGIALIMVIYTAHYLGVEQFGLFNYVRSFAAIIMTIAPLGVDSLLARNLLNNPEQRNVIMGTSLLVRGGGTVACLLLTYLVNLLVGHDAETQLLVMVVAAAAVFEPFYLLNQFFTANIQSRYHAYSEITKTLVSTAVKIGLIWYRAPLIWFALVLILESLTYALVSLRFYSVRFGSFWRWRPNFIYLRRLLTDAWPLAISGLVIMLHLKVDQVIIKHLLNTEAVGYYAAALRLSESTYFVPVVICASLLPPMLNARKISVSLYRTRLQQLFNLMVVLSLGIALPVTFLGDWIIDLVFGEAYHPAGAVLVLHIWSGVFVALGVAANGWLIAENLQRIALYRTLLGVLTNIGLNFLLIPHLGIKGSALATLISQAVTAYVSNLFSPQTRMLFFMQTRALLGFSVLRRARLLFSPAHP
ncbi:MAG: Multi antimicrobial extrusion protein (Na(+)/drug antiporter), MATE family of MDR efflux pumps [uncultured Cytophagales bacterium]|uniref:Multi antimicrobial extrusion protein (Na(+)/drug antiporter), MATE family of MDR efflux pumps n=1 Tax=uncultured Cytophagales bacterium TaxID=158755 RepID=A0A6J4K1R8_9SPHI|nr:MAG: Multi antimicrobial extrusion protein (Na(+)/drug antiporter), MATE family of MDR efflux pumps [uncultured Cytophagales bacterium]